MPWRDACLASPVQADLQTGHVNDESSMVTPVKKGGPRAASPLHPGYNVGCIQSRMDTFTVTRARGETWEFCGGCFVLVFTPTFPTCLGVYFGLSTPAETLLGLRPMLTRVA
jgi:hypothetical protein